MTKKEYSGLQQNMQMLVMFSLSAEELIMQSALKEV